MESKTNKTGFLRDDVGNLSSVRVAFFMLTIVVIFVWGYVSLSGETKSLAEIPWSVLALFIIFMSSKVIKENGADIISSLIKK